MKNLKKLKRRHKEFLSSQGLNSKDYLFIKELADCYEFYNKKAGQPVAFRR